jgi:cytochrome c-type biogenesis protein CcsB
MAVNFQAYLSNFSFLFLFISMLAYWIEISTLGIKKESTGSKTVPIVSHGDTIEDLSPLVISISDNGTSLGTSKFSLIWVGPTGMLLANGTLFILLSIRWADSGHFPLSNLYESLMFLCWSLTTIHLIIEQLFSSKTKLNQRLNSLEINSKNFSTISQFIGCITSPTALFINAFATFSLPKEMQEAGPLVPALQSNWLIMHVTVMILSYAALILGSLLSISFLVVTRNSKELTDFVEITTQKNTLIVPELKNVNISYASSNDSMITNEILIKKNNERRFVNLPRILDNLSYRVLGFGFPLLTIGLLSGAVWANEAWGSYWSWDPKETWALLTWLIFAIYLHTRFNKGWEGKKPAYIASFGFIIVWICFLGVNLLGEGLHSYGWLSNS